MKYIATALLVVWFVVLHPASTSPYDYVRHYESGMTCAIFNFKANPVSPGDVPFEDRDEEIVRDIESTGAYFIGVQECWVPRLFEDLGGYRVVGSDWLNIGGNPIIYDPEKVVLVDHGSFPLAGNINMLRLDRIGRKCYRQCSWACFWDPATKKHFYVFNVHYDPHSAEERTASSEILIEKVPQIAGDHPVMIMGDFNAEAKSLELEMLSRSLSLVDVCTVLPNTINEGTFHGFDGEEGETVWIDHFLVSASFVPESVATIEDTSEDLSSDHWPVVAELGRR